MTKLILTSLALVSSLASAQGADFPSSLNSSLDNMDQARLASVYQSDAVHNYANRNGLGRVMSVEYVFVKFGHSRIIVSTERCTFEAKTRISHRGWKATPVVDSEICD